MIVLNCRTLYKGIWYISCFYVESLLSAISLKFSFKILLSISDLIDLKASSSNCGLGSINNLYPTPNYYFIFWGVSSANNYPLDMIQILSASSSASSKCCELIMIDLPIFILFISSQTYLLDSTSRPEVGSSKIITAGLHTNAIARDNFLFIPPDKNLAFVYLKAESITISSVSEIVFETSLCGTFFNSQTNLKCSSTVNRSIRTSNY